jgi:hypothetical protein
MMLLIPIGNKQGSKESDKVKNACMFGYKDLFRSRGCTSEACYLVSHRRTFVDFDEPTRRVILDYEIFMIPSFN